MFDRSNQQKDAVTAYHGLTACGGEEDAEALRKNIAGNLEFPLHREVARLLDDSNMLVFPNSESFASWIRAQAARNGGQFFLDAGTPAILRLKTGHGTASGFSTTRRQRRTPIWGMTDGDAMTISHLANRISPREKCRDRGAGHSRRRRYAIVPGAPFPSRSDFRTRNGAFSRTKGAITARTYPHVARQHPLLEIPLA